MEQAPAVPEAVEVKIRGKRLFVCDVMYVCMFLLINMFLLSYSHPFYLPFTILRNSYAGSFMYFGGDVPKFFDSRCLSREELTHSIEEICTKVVKSM